MLDPYPCQSIAIGEVSRSQFCKNCIENVCFLLMIAKRHETVFKNNFHIGGKYYEKNN